MAHNSSEGQQSCINLFSGDTVFRNILCFLLKILSMQLNPCAIYYVMFFCRREEFEETGNEKRLNEELVDYFDDGASDMNRTISTIRDNEEGAIREGSSARYISYYG